MKRLIEWISLIVIVAIVAFLSQRAIAHLSQAPEPLAQSSQLEFIGAQENSRSYRLRLDRPEDIVFVYCPENYAPKLGLLRDVEAIQCEG
jgi:hypothetical protein